MTEIPAKKAEKQIYIEIFKILDILLQKNLAFLRKCVKLKNIKSYLLKKE